jgi:hypothetical protein
MKPVRPSVVHHLAALRSHGTLVLACVVGAALAACFSPSSQPEAEDQCPTNEVDNACEVCVKQNCCPEVTACRADGDCDCLYECLAEMPLQFDTCMDLCEGDVAPAELDMLSECAQAADCGAACE